MRHARGIIPLDKLIGQRAETFRSTSMSFKMQRVHVFHSEIEDKPGGISAKLKKLAEGGAHLEYV